MSQRILIPFVNPIKFVQENPSLFSQYARKDFDNSTFKETIFPWQQPKCYAQKISVNDVISLQIESNYDPLTLHLIDEDENVLLTFAFQNSRRNEYNSDYYIYEVDMSFAPVTPGSYWLRLLTGVGGPTFISEPLLVINDISDTVLIEYSNSSFYQEVVWETGITMGMRLEGSLSKFTPGSKDVVYEDQVLNNTMLSSRPYRTWTLFIGGTFGVPDWVIDKLNRILGCDNLKIDGKYFSKAEGAKWEKKEEEDYPMAGWSIELREELNRDSVVFDSDVPSNKKLVIGYNIESEGFGDLSDNAGSNIIVITDLE